MHLNDSRGSTAAGAGPERRVAIGLSFGARTLTLLSISITRGSSGLCRAGDGHKRSPCRWGRLGAGHPHLARAPNRAWCCSPMRQPARVCTWRRRPRGACAPSGTTTRHMTDRARRDGATRAQRPPKVSVLVVHFSQVSFCSDAPRGERHGMAHTSAVWKCVRSTECTLVTQPNVLLMTRVFTICDIPL